MTRAAPMSRAELAEALGTTPDQISEYVRRGIIHDLAIVRADTVGARGGKVGRHVGYIEDTARRQVQAYKAGRASRAGTPGGLQGGWGEAARAYGRILQRKTALDRCPDKLTITTRPTASQFGAPIKQIDEATRALIDNAVAARNHKHAPLHGGG